MVSISKYLIDYWIVVDDAHAIADNEADDRHQIDYVPRVIEVVVELHL